MKKLIALISIICFSSTIIHAQDTINARVSDDYRIHPIFHWVKCKYQKEQENTSTLDIDCQDFYRLNMLVDDSILFELKMPERNSPLYLTNIPAGKHSVVIWERIKPKKNGKNKEVPKFRYEFTSYGKNEMQVWEMPRTEIQRKRGRRESVISLSFLLLTIIAKLEKN